MFEKITRALAKFFILIGKTANWVLSIALGRTLTIDDIVFNRYDDIRLDFFTYDSDGNEVTVTSGLVNSLKSPINKCYKVFSQIAIVGYMIILVYVGIVMMLNASSPDKKASGKIVELMIPADAKRSSATSRKCRASKATVISITDIDGNPCGDSVKSNFDSKFIYTVGATIEIPNFDENRWNECSTGIHHFITREEAVKY